MGFRIQLSGSARNLLDKLTTSPASVFDKPYNGYMLFLAGAADQETCEWIASNTIQLDSLTGSDIAYAVFARSFSVRLRTSTPGIQRELRPPRVVGKVTSQELADGGWKVERLVKSGRWGWIVDGDELVATTYAVDEVARHLGVLDKLPCVVIFDAIPQEDLDVIQLTPAVKTDFVDILRRTLNVLSKSSSFKEQPEEIRKLLASYGEIDKAKDRHVELKRKRDRTRSALEALEHSGPVAAADRREIASRLQEARVALNNSSLQGFRLALSGGRKGRPTAERAALPGLEPNRLARVLMIAEREHPRLWSLGRTIQALQTANGADEPERSERLQIIFTKHVSGLVGRTAVGGGRKSVLQVEKTVQTLKRIRQSVIEDILFLLPDEAALVSNLERSRRQSHNRKVEELRKKVDLLERRVRDLEGLPEAGVEAARARYEAALNEYVASKPPSFSAEMQKSLRARRLHGYRTTVQGWGSELAGGLFQPGFLLRFWQAIAG